MAPGLPPDLTAERVSAELAALPRMFAEEVLERLMHIAGVGFAPPLQRAP